MNYKEVIESRYNRQNWQLLLHDIFGSKIRFWNTPSVVTTSSPFAKHALWLGTITLSDEQTIAVYEVELSESVDIERNRRGIRDMLLTAWRNNGNAGAFMFCYRKNESVLRFSYVSESWKFADDGSYQKESTDTRRYTYLLGEGHRSRTAIQQFEKLRDSQLSLKDLTKAFSVDAVSDMFFDGYKKQYENIIFYITGKRMVKVANKWEERLEGQPCQYIMRQFSHFPNPEKSIRDYVKKLMGRLVFLQFLQKKGWLGVGAHDEWGNGDPEFIQNLFASCNDKDHFIDNVLEPLFNDLNTEEGKKLPQYRTPYLNGGLFEREAADETDFPLPAQYMQSLLDFFASYNFTIDENDPDDAEVGVDPEMLGRIFENLLEDNKDKGAFYTPKEIVSYMCRESLIAYLQTGIQDEATKEAIRLFVTTHQIQEHLPESTDQLLKDVKICDPAIGSGAFPMGLLKELFLCRTALEGISQHQAAEIKKHIIQQNVYGVDIERGAVDIARLRFWLSLIVDEETPQALPNLDFKIMQGNSLLEQYKGVDLSAMTERKLDRTGMYSFFEDMIDVYRRELREMLAEYYDCTNHHEKQILRERIINNVKQQLKENNINVDFGDLVLSGNNQFFLWHTWFHDVFSKGGFDIVIGNPPYIRQEKLEHAYKRLLCSIYPEVGEGTADILVYFFGLGIKILCENGILSFITSNKFLKTQYGRSIRRSFANDVDVVSFIDFFELPVFNNASTDAGITLLCKRQPISNTKYFPVKTLNNLNLTVLTSGDYLRVIKHEAEWQFVRKEELSILCKLNKNSIPLTEFVNNRIYRGITTGLNQCFMLNRIVRDQILVGCATQEEKKKTDAVIKKAFRSRDVRKYRYTGPEQWLLFVPWHFPLPFELAERMTPKEALKKAESKLKEEYPSLYRYLLSNYNELAGRNKDETGIRYEWYALQRWGANYYQEFDEEKLIYIHTAKNHEFYYDTDKHYVNNSCYIIANKSKFLFCFLNSSLFKYFKKIKFVAYGDGAEEGRCKLDGNKMATVPIRYNVDERPFEKLFDELQKAVNNDNTARITDLESEIDHLIYRMYDLTEDEIKIVEGIV